MIGNKITKIYYSILFVFFAVLTSSYSNIASGGAVLWISPNLFYFCMLIFASTLTYVILNSKYDYLQRLELPGVLLFCLSLPLLLNIGIHQFPPDLDSVISMQSIPFVKNYGFSADLAGKKDLLISATYSLPMLSIFSASFMQILGITYIVTAKYVPMIIVTIFFFIYYAFVSKFIGKKVALISLILISTYMWNYGSVVNNADLALVLILLSWWFIFWREHNKKHSINVIIIQLITLIVFVMTHHLTYFMFILSNILLSLFLYIKNQKKIVNNSLLAIILMFSYYIYVYFGPLEIMINAFTKQLLIEGKTSAGVTEWVFPIILQRISYVVFLIPPILLSIIEAKKNLKDFLSESHSIFLLIGISLFLSSIMGIILKAPFNWGRVAIFGWFFYIPGAINILIETEILKKIYIKQSIIIFTLSLLVLGNIYVIPVNIMDHSGDREYEGAFKNWIKLQEWESALFLNKYVDDNSLIVGDEVVLRTYAVNSPDYYVNFKQMSSDFYKIDDSDIAYLVIRKENFYRIIGGFYKRATDKTESNETAITEIQYKNISSDENIFLVYDNEEVRIFYQMVLDPKRKMGNSYKG